MEAVSVREWHSIYADAINIVRSAGIENGLDVAILYDPATLRSEWLAQRAKAVDGVASGATLAPFIDHTLLRADATSAQVMALCHEARAYGFAAVCVNPVFTTLAVECSGGAFHVASVAGFPLGAHVAAITCSEIARAVAEGATEIDVVQPLRLVKQRDLARLRAVLQSYRDAAAGAALKVIVETAALTDAEKVASAWCACAAGADFVKTSTGFGASGASVRDVALLRLAAGPTKGVKASGGIRDVASARAMLDAGADRLGTSASVALCAPDPAA